MKTERRHELQTNDLAHQIARGINQVRPFASVVMVNVLIAAVIVVGIVVYLNMSSRRAAEAWRDVIIASERDQFVMSEVDVREKLDKAAGAHPGTNAEAMARLWAANEELQNATLLGDMPGARSHLDQAVSEYRALQTKGVPEPVRQLATFNLGVAYEMLNKLEDAKKEYAAVDGPLQDVAQQRAKRLDDASLVDFYAAYSEAVATRTRAGSSGPGMPGQRPPFDIEGDSPFAPFDINRPVNVPGEDDVLPSLFLDDPNKPATAPSGDATGETGEAPTPNLGDGKPPEPPADAEASTPETPDTPPADEN